MKIFPFSDEACDIIMFGKSSKKTLDSQIGMYGNGLKSLVFHFSAFKIYI